MKKYQIKAFTLVELIIVITILAILATIGFMSYQSYTIDSRDTNRITNLQTIKDGLTIYKIKNNVYPMPDNYLTITASGETISYQGDAGIQMLGSIKLSDIRDPMDKTYYTYLVNSDKTFFQLLGFLETDTSNLLSYNTNFEKAYALDYSTRYPQTMGDKLGIILNTNNFPITGTGVDIVLTNNVYKAVMDNTNSGNIIGTGGLLKSLSVIGESSSSFATSCDDIKTKHLDFKGDGTYWINPTGTGSFQVYCNMSTDGGGWILFAKNYGSPAYVSGEVCSNNSSICNGGISDKLKPFLQNNITQIAAIDGNKAKVMSFTVTDINHNFMKALKGELTTHYTSLSITGAITNVTYNDKYEILTGSYLQSYFSYLPSGSKFLICSRPGSCGKGPLFSIGWGNYSGYYSGELNKDNNLYGGVYLK